MNPTPEQVAQWSREAGVKAGEIYFYRGGYDEMTLPEQEDFDAVSRLVTRAMAEQAEADAKLCDGLSGRSYEFDLWRLHCGHAIRASAPKVKI